MIMAIVAKLSKYENMITKNRSRIPIMEPVSNIFASVVSGYKSSNSLFMKIEHGIINIKIIKTVCTAMEYSSKNEQKLNCL